jgi:hypothetical protein
MKRWTPLLLAIVVTLLVAGVASACPMCKDSTGTSEGLVTRGFGHSVYIMLGGFFGCLGIITYNLVRGIRGK